MKIFARVILAVCLVLSSGSLAYAEQTTLRAGAVDGVWASKQGLTQLREVKVKVKNVGETEAIGVKVEAILPDGTSLRLAGSRRIPRNSEEGYHRTVRKLITKKGSIKARVSCRNCR